MTDDTKAADAAVKVDVTLTGDDAEMKQLVGASAQMVTTAYVALLPLKNRLAIKALAAARDVRAAKLQLGSGGSGRLV